MLDEATARDLGRAEGHRLVMLAVLAIVGLGWREAQELIAASPELALGATAAAGDPAPIGAPVDAAVSA